MSWEYSYSEELPTPNKKINTEHKVEICAEHKIMRLSVDDLTVDINEEHAQEFMQCFIESMERASFDISKIKI